MNKRIVHNLNGKGKASQCRQFTLIELLVVVAIIGILLSILMPGLRKAREATKKAVCLSNTAQLTSVFLTNSVNNNGRISTKSLDNDPGDIPWDLDISLYEDIKDFTVRDNFYCPLNPLKKEHEGLFNSTNRGVINTHYIYTYKRNHSFKALSENDFLRDKSDQGNWVDLLSKVPAPSQKVLMADVYMTDQLNDPTIEMWDGEYKTNHASSNSSRFDQSTSYVDGHAKLNYKRNQPQFDTNGIILWW